MCSYSARILGYVTYVFVFPSYSGAHNLCARIPPVRMYPLLGCIPERILYVLFYIPLPLDVRLGVCGKCSKSVMSVTILMIDTV